MITIAKKYERTGVLFNDLVQEGYFGLIEASSRFDPNRGFKFCTYATWWIRQRISKAVADNSRAIRLPVHVHSAVNNMQRVKKNMESELGRVPTMSELSAVLEIPEKKLKLYSDASRQVLSLSMPVTSNEGQPDKTLSDMFASPGPEPEHYAEMSMLRRDLTKIMTNGLNENEKSVLEMSFGLNDLSAQSADEISLRLKIPRERVKVIENRALNKLRHPSKSR